MKKILFLNLLLSCFLGLFACDQLEDDAIPVEKDNLQLKASEKNVFILPAGEAIIDLRESLKVNSNATLMLGAKPNKGGLEFIENGLLRYTAHASFTSGQDLFTLKILKDTTILDQDTIQIIIPTDTLEYPCWTGAMADSLYLTNDSLEVGAQLYNILENDFLCDSSSYKISLYSKPDWGTAEIVGDYLQYLPGPAFKNSDQLVYQLCEFGAGDSLRCTLAQVFINVKDRSDSVHCTTALQAVNDQKTIWLDSISADSTLFRIDVLNNDIRCRGLISQEISTLPVNGNAYLQDSLLYYSFPEGFMGTDSLKYIICDSDTSCSEGSVIIEVK